MEKHKTINLDSDPIFLNSAPYDDFVGYENTSYDDMPVDEKTRANRVRDEILELVIQGKLDATDLKIIEARDCSPMPSNMELSRTLKIPEATIRFKVARVKALISKELHPKKH